MEKAFNSFLS